MTLIFHIKLPFCQSLMETSHLSSTHFIWGCPGLGAGIFVFSNVCWWSLDVCWDPCGCCHLKLLHMLLSFFPVRCPALKVSIPRERKQQKKKILSLLHLKVIQLLASPPHSLHKEVTKSHPASKGWKMDSTSRESGKFLEEHLGPEIFWGTTTCHTMSKVEDM